MASGTKGRGKATTKSTTKKAAAKAGKASGSTRTSARSAKRRSPKSDASSDDGELLEVERVEFLKAIDAYKRKTGQTFPSWTEVLAVLRDIGWLSPMRLADRKAKQT
jgi:hypothetical protein